MTRDTTDRIRRSLILLQNPHAYLNGDGQYEALVPERTEAALIDMARVLDGRRKGRTVTKPDIERIARNLQNEMWLRRAELFPSVGEVDPLQILDPELALQSLGYKVVVRESLGQHAGGKRFVRGGWNRRQFQRNGGNLTAIDSGDEEIYRRS